LQGWILASKMSATPLFLVIIQSRAN